MSNKLVAIEYNYDEKKNAILLNILKMLSERKLLSKQKIDKLYSKLKDIMVDDMVYDIKVDSGKIYSVKINEYKITTINKVTSIIDFLNTNKDNNKIMVVSDLNKKAYKQLMEYPNTEVFWDYECMTNLIDYVYIPKHILLSDEEKNVFETKYFSTKRETPKIESTDPVARYYNMKVNDIVKIIRPSIMSGYTVSYRRVIKAPISRIFDR